MPTIKRETVSEPVLGEEETHSDAIGGTVIVRGMLMSERMAMWEEEKQREGETPEAAKARANQFIVPATLARSVFLDDGQPLWTAAMWNIFAGKNNDEAMRLFDIAQRLQGMNVKALEKNLPSSQNGDLPSP